VSLSGRDVVRARGLSPPKRHLLIAAIVWLGLFRVAVLMLPYRRVASLLRLTQWDASEVSLASAADRGLGGGCRDAAIGGRDAEAIGWAVQAVAARTPWLSTCLVQSLAGYMMLRRHDVPSIVYLGVAKDAGGEFTAHSWLQCGDRIVTGGGSHQRYSVIAAYRPPMGGCG
jgi:hypothetical protein